MIIDKLPSIDQAQVADRRVSKVCPSIGVLVFPKVQITNLMMYSLLGVRSQ